MINQTLKQKIQMPLWTIVRTCQTAIKMDELKQFELMKGDNKISSSMDQMSFHCQLVSLKLDDMQDLALMIDDKFKKRSSFFDFSKAF